MPKEKGNSSGYQRLVNTSPIPSITLTKSKSSSTSFCVSNALKQPALDLVFPADDLPSEQKSIESALPITHSVKYKTSKNTILNGTSFVACSVGPGAAIWDEPQKLVAIVLEAEKRFSGGYILFFADELQYINLLPTTIQNISLSSERNHSANHFDAHLKTATAEATQQALAMLDNWLTENGFKILNGTLFFRHGAKFIPLTKRGVVKRWRDVIAEDRLNYQDELAQIEFWYRTDANFRTNIDHTKAQILHLHPKRAPETVLTYLFTEYAFLTAFFTQFKIATFCYPSDMPMAFSTTLDYFATRKPQLNNLPTWTKICIYEKRSLKPLRPETAVAADNISKFVTVAPKRSASYKNEKPKIINSIWINRPLENLCAAILTIINKQAKKHVIFSAEAIANLAVLFNDFIAAVNKELPLPAVQNIKETTVESSEDFLRQSQLVLKQLQEHIATLDNEHTVSFASANVIIVKITALHQQIKDLLRSITLSPIVTLEKPITSFPALEHRTQRSASESTLFHSAARSQPIPIPSTPNNYKTKSKPFIFFGGKENLLVKSSGSASNASPDRMVSSQESSGLIESETEITLYSPPRWPAPF